MTDNLASWKRYIAMQGNEAVHRNGRVCQSLNEDLIVTITWMLNARNVRKPVHGKMKSNWEKING